MLIQGTNISAPVVPNDSNDVFASHEAKYGKGGWRTVADIAERDAITTERRENLMPVAVEADGKTYVLKLGTASQDLNDNANWVEFASADVDKAYVDAQDTVTQNFVIAELDALYQHVDDADAQLQTNLNLVHDDLQQQIDSLPNGSDFVHKTGDEGIAGVKTFTDKIGIGTYTPEWPLDIAVGSPGNGASLQTQADILLKSGSIFFGGYSYGGNFVGGHPAFGNMFGLYGGQTMVTLSGGKVGIGKGYATEALDVAGNVKADNVILGYGQTTMTPNGITTYNTTYKVYSENADLQLQSRDGDISIGSGNSQGHTPNLVVKNGGNVGINTTTPTQKLEVNGNVKAVQFIGDGSQLTNLPSAQSIANTDALAEGNTNKYFTSARVISTPLTGLTAISGTPSASDSILTAWGKVLYLFTITMPSKAPLNSPTFTGVVTVPTATQNTNNGTAASTAMVQSAICSAPMFVIHKPDGTVDETQTDFSTALGIAAGGRLIVNRPLLANPSTNVLTAGTILDMQNYPLNLNGTVLRMYEGAKVINNKLIHNGRLVPQGNCSVQGGTVAARINFAVAAWATVTYDGVMVTDMGQFLHGVGTNAGLATTAEGGTVVLRNGSKFVNYAPDAATTVRVDTVIFNDPADAANKVGIGTTTPTSKLTVSGDIEAMAGFGIIVPSANGTRYRMTPSNDGLSTIWTAI